jgi:hypothetical protein
MVRAGEESCKMKLGRTPVDLAVLGNEEVSSSGKTPGTITSPVPLSVTMYEGLTELHASAIVADRDEGDRIYSSAAHLAIAMKLALYGKASVSELREYLRREGVAVTGNEVMGVLQEFRRCGYVSGDLDGFVAEEPLVEVVKRRAPSKAHLESKARPLAI